ncbi:MAG: hypothetical protein K1Y36_04845 [Blastocatellia bacterium]|nr:hypothetical protein [Blastocatellia bacterium]
MRHIIRILFLAMVGWFGGTTWVLQAHPAPLQGPPPQGGPVTHKVYSATSKDGLNWTADNVVLLEKASVPCAAVTKDGKIRIYYVDASTMPEGANVAESTDGGKTFKPLGLKIINRAEFKAVDPSIVQLKDGRFRLYYYAAKMQIGEKDLHSVHSAISTDGVTFTEEQGNLEYPGLVDPDVFKARKEWLMFVFSLTDLKTIVASSRDGLNFKYVGPLSVQGYGTTAPVKLDDGRFRLYAFNQRGNRTFHSFVSTDGLNWTEEPGIRLQLEGPGQITDPFVVRLSDGTWKMFYKYGPEGGNPPPPTSSDANFYMSFHACNPASANCGDPRNHQVYLAQSTDGVKWSPVPNWKPFAGSVPDVIRRGNTLYIFSVGNGGRLARYHLDTKIQDEAVPFSVSGLDNLGFVDPSLTMDENGKLVLFFLRGLGPNGSDPAGCGSQSSCEKFFGSATEVDGSDGAQFTLDSGSRALVSLGGSSPYRSASDPDIFFDGKQYVLYISHGPSISVWTSAQLRGSYLKTLDLSTQTGGIPSGYFDSQSGKYWTFSHITQNGAAVIRRAVHSDFSKSLVETDWSTVLTAPLVNLPAGVNVESPGFAVGKQ